MQNKTLQKEAAPNEGPKHPTSNGGRRQQLTADFNQSVKPSKWELPRRPRSLARAVSQGSGMNVQTMQDQMVDTYLITIPSLI
jgi:hypothetical protein